MPKSEQNLLLMAKYIQQVLKCSIPQDEKKNFYQIFRDIVVQLLQHREVFVFN